MKKFFIAFALVSVMLNGFLSTMDRGLSSDELSVGDVELMAEGESDIGPVGVALLGALVQIGEASAVYYITQGGGEWVTHKGVDRHGYLIWIEKVCEKCSIFSDEGCTPRESIKRYCRDDYSLD